MPGSRLTAQDRRRIASGVAEGLSYAEIARRLQRPTSTVSREVARNGGYDAYGADSAQQATSRRARRVRTPEPHPAPAAQAGVRAYEVQFTDLMTRTGLARMPARVLYCLLTSEAGSLAAADLIHHLQVSPASVSKAVTYLEQMRLIRREVGGRRQRYVLDDDAWHRAGTWVVRVCAMWADAARRGARLFEGTSAGVRLEEMGRYFEYIGRDVDKLAEHWPQELAALRRGRSRVAG
jgi:predicted transcriptional regulator